MGSKDKGIRKSEFDAKTQFLYHLKTLFCFDSTAPCLLSNQQRCFNIMISLSRPGQLNNIIHITLHYMIYQYHNIAGYGAL